MKENSENKIVIRSEDFNNLEIVAKETNKELNNLEGTNIFGIFLLAIGKIAMTIFELVFGIINQLIKKSPEYIQKLADYGWYISEELGFRDIFFLVGNASIGNEEEVDKIMNGFIQQNINIIKTELIRKFPKREKYFVSAFKAHKRKDYIASVPILLAQVDWVSKQVIGVKFFSNKKIMGKFRPKTITWLEQINPDIITGMLLEPLKYKSAFGKHNSEVDENQITRNKVFHGDDIDYDNITISNKAISLLYYLSTVVYDAKFKYEN